MRFRAGDADSTENRPLDKRGAARGHDSFEALFERRRGRVEVAIDLARREARQAGIRRVERGIGGYDRQNDFNLAE